MGDINVSITLKDGYITRIMNAFEAFSEKDISQEVPSKPTRFNWSYDPQGTEETNEDFVERVLREFIRAFVRDHELNEDYVRYKDEVGDVSQPSQSVPDEIVE